MFKMASDTDKRTGAATLTAALDLIGLGLNADRRTIKITSGLKVLAFSVPAAEGSAVSSAPDRDLSLTRSCKSAD